MIHVQFETNAADWRAFQRNALAGVRGFTGKASLRLSWRPIVLGIPVGLLLFLGMQLFAFRLHTPTAAVIVGIFLLFWGFFRWRFASALTPAAEGGLIGPRHLALDENGVVEESRNHKHQSTWSGIVSVEETGEHVFLMVDRVAGYIVPKRAFRDSSGLEAFVTFARVHLRGQDGRTQPDKARQPTSGTTGLK